MIHEYSLLFCFFSADNSQDLLPEPDAGKPPFLYPMTTYLKPSSSDWQMKMLSSQFLIIYYEIILPFVKTIFYVSHHTKNDTFFVSLHHLNLHLDILILFYKKERRNRLCFQLELTLVVQTSKL